VAPYDLADLNAHLYGWLYKFTPEGDSIWARADLSTIPYQSGIDDNVFGGVDFLSSGSIVAGGNSYINGQFYGWIIKVTPDGCIDTLLCQPLAARPAAPVPAPAVFPNPASGQAYVRYSLPGGAEFQLYDAMGRLALQQRLPGGDRQETLLLAGLASGIYYWQITAAGEMLAGGKLVLH
ncbi:MAG TPA: T9SS type A sorting domain-containing protein, partial [Saprospiraceae bacterium]|nr:T9SS type A sorting domain-containing protein [Saprospiraceae bacterium]